MTRGGDEGLTDPSPFLTAHRDILQIGIGRGQATGSRHRLMVGGMYPSGMRVDLLWQFIGVGGLELGQGTMFQDQARQRVVQRQLLHYLLSGGGLALGGLFQHRQAELFVQNDLDLLG